MLSSYHLPFFEVLLFSRLLHTPREINSLFAKSSLGVFRRKLQSSSSFAPLFQSWALFFSSEFTDLLIRSIVLAVFSPISPLSCFEQACIAWLIFSMDAFTPLQPCHRSTSYHNRYILVNIPALLYLVIQGDKGTSRLNAASHIARVVPLHTPHGSTTVLPE